MFEILSILLKWIKPILIFTVLAAILSAGLSLLLTNYYESTVIFQPSNPSLIDRSMFTKDGAEKSTYMFGSKVDIDRIITLGNSSNILGYAINQYNLFGHYEIDPNANLAEFKVAKKFRQNFSIAKNAQGSLSLSIVDKDPQKAADWANDLADKIDGLNRDIILSKKQDQVKILESQLQIKKSEVANLTDSLQKLTRNTPNDTLSSSLLRSMLNDVVDDYKGIKTSYDQTKAIINQDIKTFYYYEYATPAKRKIKPVRSLIVIGCTIFTFLSLAFAAVFVEKFKEYQIIHKDVHS